MIWAIGEYLIEYINLLLIYKDKCIISNNIDNLTLHKYIKYILYKKIKNHKTKQINNDNENTQTSAHIYLNTINKMWNNN